MWTVAYVNHVSADNEWKRIGLSRAQLFKSVLYDAIRCPLWGLCSALSRLIRHSLCYAGAVPSSLDYDGLRGGNISTTMTSFFSHAAASCLSRGVVGNFRSSPPRHETNPTVASIEWRRRLSASISYASSNVACTLMVGWLAIDVCRGLPNRARVSRP